MMDRRALVENMDIVGEDSLKFWTTRRKTLFLSCTTFIVVVVCATFVGLFHIKDGRTDALRPSCHGQVMCQYSHCNVSLVESIPQNLTYPEGSPSHLSVFDGWMLLLDVAQSSIHIASSYWTLRGDDLPVKDASSWQGQVIFDRLVEAGKRGVDIKIVHEVSSDTQPNYDTAILQEMGLAQVRTLNLDRLLGAGILHSKMWLVDGKHFYVGSANLDWRSLTQVKELGVLISNCTCLGADMAKIFDVYWMLAEPNSTIPDPWPPSLDTDINKETPLSLTINGDRADTYLASSPPPICPQGRTTDIDAILDVIQKARQFIHISVMDYSASFLYSYPKKFWSVIDDALRAAAFNRGVKVFLMASIWPHTVEEMIPFLKSLSILSDISHVDVEVRLFRVPIYTKAQGEIPYARVQHTKYMVTENAAYIGTSNWSGDYFVSTAGIGCIINQTMSSQYNQSSQTIQQQLQDVFSRDWNSNYTTSIWDF